MKDALMVDVIVKRTGVGEEKQSQKEQMRMQTSDASAVKKKAGLNLAQAGMRDSRMI